MILITPLVWFALLASFVSWAKTSPPISEWQWKNLIGDKANASYAVKMGDSLSRISRQELGDVDYWPKLWEVNQESIRNPHLLEPDQKLLFSRVVEAGPTREPNHEGLKRTTKKKNIDLETDELIRPDYVNGNRLKFLLLEDEEILGVITGSYDEKNYLGPESKVFVGPLVKDKVRVGERYAIVREVKVNAFTKNVSQEMSGHLIQIIGELEIESFGDELAKANITSANDTVERGDRIMNVSVVSLQEPAQIPPAELMLRVLAGDNLEHTYFSSGQMLLLNGGKTSGVQLGHVFNIYEDTDPIFKNQTLIEPRSKGVVKIVHLSDRSSVGYIQENSSGVEVGDILVSATILPKSLSKIKTNRQPVFIE